MNNLKAKLKKEGGFTLVEMLIVVAIIAILIAISIPMVNKALEKARHAVDQANIRDAIGLANIELLTEEPPTTGTTRTYKYVVDETSHQGTLVDKADTSTEATAKTAVTAQCKCTGNPVEGGLEVTADWSDFKVTVNWKTNNASTPVAGATEKP